MAGEQPLTLAELQRFFHAQFDHVNQQMAKLHLRTNCPAPPEEEVEHDRGRGAQLGEQVQEELNGVLVTRIDELEKRLVVDIPEQG
ncbi:unnamed protein product [Linum trigynum]|uniref:Uncharacterized protein n=1 Tax=Linum trigynum TaxID=586398 RepID=A0AAV2FUK4_9ROSI